MSYRLGALGQIIRKLDNAFIPVDAANKDYRAFLEWKAQGGVPDPYVAPPPTQDELDVVAAKGYAKLRALRNATPSQVQSWVDANVNTLADAKDLLKTLAVAVCILARRL